jgi:Zn-finger nucleic acid-binding protein
MSLKKELLDKKIDCPRCFVDMVQREAVAFGPKLIIDICPKCEGLWLDAGELKKLVHDRKLSDYLTKDIGTQSKSKLVCPRCGGLMDLEFADDVEVDVCLNCSGVWLDSGELQALKDKSKSGFEGDDLEKAVERWEDHISKSRARKGSFLSRLLGK